ncbi:hypothetical protein CSPX01_06996, partial [Colletotrichum filicis]
SRREIRDRWGQRTTIRLPSDLIKTLSGKTQSKPSSWKPIHPRGQAPESNCRPVNGARLASVLPALIIDGWGFLSIQSSNSTTQSILGSSTHHLMGSSHGMLQWWADRSALNHAGGQKGLSCLGPQKPRCRQHLRHGTSSAFSKEPVALHDILLEHHDVLSNAQISPTEWIKVNENEMQHPIDPFSCVLSLSQLHRYAAVLLLPAANSPVPVEFSSPHLRVRTSTRTSTSPIQPESAPNCQPETLFNNDLVSSATAQYELITRSLLLPRLFVSQQL